MSDGELLVERVVADMSSAPLDVAFGALQSAISFDRQMPALLAELNLPVVAINPDDQWTDVASLERHEVEVVLMPNVGHFLMMEEPDAFNELLDDVIEGFGR